MLISYPVLRLLEKRDESREARCKLGPKYYQEGDKWFCSQLTRCRMGSLSFVTGDTYSEGGVTCTCKGRGKWSCDEYVF